MIWFLGCIVANILGTILCRKKLEEQYEVLYQSMREEDPTVDKKSLIRTGVIVCVFGFIPIYIWGFIEGWMGK